MAEKSKISWTDSTLNFWEGCTKKSAGCANCYAEARDKRFTGGTHWGPSGIRRKSKLAVKDALRLNAKPWVCDECGEAYKDIPYDGNGGAPAVCSKRDADGVMCSTGRFHRRRIFSLSLGDWLEGPQSWIREDGTAVGGIPVEWRAEMLDTIRRCPDVEWILCTKRPEAWRERMIECMKLKRDEMTEELQYTWTWAQRWINGSDIPPNVTLLASVENQEQADIRIPALLRIPAARRGLSLEPLLGPVDLEWVLDGVNPLTRHNCLRTGKIDWLIIGGESGPKARPCNVEWIRSLVKQGNAAGVPVFVKQLGAHPVVTMTAANRHGPPPDDFRAFSDPKGADPSEWPENLRVQQFPFVS